MFANIIEFDKLTRTAAEAAEALGCDINQIAKSIIFKLEDETPLLIITSGGNRVDETKVESVVGKKLLKADADYCKKVTGYVIGGIPPYGHIQKIRTLMDEDLNRYQIVYAAAGKPNAVFKTTPKELLEKAQAETISFSSK